MKPILPGVEREAPPDVKKIGRIDALRRSPGREGGKRCSITLDVHFFNNSEDAQDETNYHPLDTE